MTDPTDSDVQEYEVDDDDGITRTYLLTEEDAAARQARKVQRQETRAAQKSEREAEKAERKATQEANQEERQTERADRVAAAKQAKAPKNKQATPNAKG